MKELKNGDTVEFGAPVSMCQNCWEELREAIKMRGLDHLVSKNGHSLADRMQRMAAGDRGNDNFDPLIQATLAIYANMVRAFGAALGSPNAPPCILCWMNEHANDECDNPDCSGKHDSGHDWINYAADGQLKDAQKRGLVSLPN